MRNIMVKTGKLQKRRGAALPLLLLFALGLAGPAFPEATAGREVKENFVKTAWVKRHGGPYFFNDAVAMDVDGRGNVYVTGYSGVGPYVYDYITVKYSPQGRVLWARVYNGPENFADFAATVKVDGQGNVYVTGTSTYVSTLDQHFIITTIKYSPDGQELWVRRYQEPDGAGAWDMALDDQGNIYVTGYSCRSRGYGDYTTDYLTLKYSPDGRVLWARRYHGPLNRSDEARAVVVDGPGNVYVTGSSEGSGTGEDFATIKYSPDGRQLWVRRYNGPANNLDAPRAIAVDGQGNVYVTGMSYGVGTGTDYATLKYSPDGRQLWARRYHGPSSDDEPQAIAVDGQGNVYVTGNSYSDNYTAAATVKYSPDGRQLWVRRYYGPNGSSHGEALAVDARGYLYVTGSERGGTTTASNCLTLKYSPEGETLWIRRYHGPENQGDWSRIIAVDGQRNVYVSGGSDVSSGYNYLTIKYTQTP